MRSIEHIDPWLHCKELVEQILMDAVRADSGESGPEATLRDDWARRIAADLHPKLSAVSRERIRELTLLSIVREVMEEILIDSADLLRADFWSYALREARDRVDDLILLSLEGPPEEEDVREAAYELLEEHGLKFKRRGNGAVVACGDEMLPVCLDGVIDEEDHDGVFRALATASEKWGIWYETGCCETWIGRDWRGIPGRDVERAIAEHRYADEEEFVDYMRFELSGRGFREIEAPDHVMAIVLARTKDAKKILKNGVLSQLKSGQDDHAGRLAEASV